MMIRTFIAIKIPEQELLIIRHIQNALKKAGGDVKWVNPEKMHLTLKFLGDTDSGLIGKVTQAVQNALKSETAFDVSIRGFGGFPDIKRPRVLWLGIDKGRDALARIAGSIDRELEMAGFTKEKRPFSPHLTLGRVRSLKNIDKIADLLREAEPETGIFCVKHIDIMKSDLKPTGSVYTVLDNILI